MFNFQPCAMKTCLNYRTNQSGRKEVCLESSYRPTLLLQGRVRWSQFKQKLCMFMIAESICRGSTGNARLAIDSNGSLDSG